MTLHIGNLIREELSRQPKAHTVTWFAEQLNCNRRNIYDIFSRTDIDTNLLRRICKILNHDFFRDISEYISQEESSSV